MSNFVVFLIKTAVMFLIFWLMLRFGSQSTALANSQPWVIALVLGAVTAFVDYIVDVLVPRGSKTGDYLQYNRKGV